MTSKVPPWRATAPATATATQYASPAYIPVQARLSLAHNSQPAPSTPAVSSAPEPAPAPRRKVEWPLPVRQYVQRSFAPENAIPGVSREEMEAKLRLVITGVAENNKLDVVDWNSLPLPQAMIQNERNRILAHPSMSVRESSVNAVPQQSHMRHEEKSKKRKSVEVPHQVDGFESIPPWRQTNFRNDYEDHPFHSQPDKRPKIDHKISSKFETNLEMRRNRFGVSHGPLSPTSRVESPTLSVNQGPIIGRCQNLEKNYFRLTAPPNPDTVRPLHVLEKTLDLLKRKWKFDNNYAYICDQFKSLRQDLTVQHIKNEFTVNVYEHHARIALEKGDLGEYNQCQTQLRALYAQNLGGHPTEFKAYRILYFIYTRNWTAMNDALADVTAADKRDRAVKHALEVRSALALGNYHRFFQLFLDTPNMGAYLMDMFVDRERLSALAAICKAYKPDVKIRFITEELGFESDEQSARFILDHASEDLLEEKDGFVKLLTSKAGRVFEQAKAEAYRVVDLKGQI